METVASVWADRHFPIGAIADQCRAVHGSGVVDAVLIPDQLANFIPQQLWTAENTPLAQMMGDPDSTSDPFVIGGYVAAAVPGLGLHLTTDAVRRPPAELIQSMLTLANVTEGNAVLQVGGGEVKQTKPFGHPTKQGPSRMKDLFRIYRKMMDSDGPIDYEGKRWTFKDAYLGGARQHKPEIWGLGAGPDLFENTAAYADGLATAVKMAFPTAEETHEAIASVRRRMEELGRDPSGFRVQLWATALLVDDEEQFEQAAANPIIRYITGTLGRIETWRWAEEGEGMALPVSEDWTYYRYLLPYGMSDSEVQGVVDAVTPEHVRRAWFIGTPEDVAKQIEPFAAEGVDSICPFDYLPIWNGDAEGAVRRMIELCGLLKKL